MRYTTITDVIEQAILPALGEYAEDFDAEAIARATYEYKVDTDEAGNELLNSAGFEQAVSDEEFLAIAADHCRS